MDNKTIGKFIQELRIEKGLTQKELASKLHVTNKAISKWECGRGCPDISLLEELSEVLGVSVMELLNGKRIEEPNLREDYLKTSLDYSNKLIHENTSHFNKRLLLVSLVLFLGIGVLFHQMTKMNRSIPIEAQKQVEPFSYEHFLSLKCYHTPYIGDNSKVSNIVGSLPLSEYGYSIEILSEIFQLDVYYHDVDWNINTLNNDETYIHKAILYNALVGFSCIDNMESIQFNFSGSSYLVTKEQFNTWFLGTSNKEKYQEYSRYIQDEELLKENVEKCKILS